MDRRRFLQMCGGGMVATATMAEVGFFADFMAWVKRMPVWSIPKPAIHCTIEQYADFISASELLSDTAISPCLAHLATVYYDRSALMKLDAMMGFYQLSERIEIPESTGKTIQLYA